MAEMKQQYPRAMAFVIVLQSLVVLSSCSDSGTTQKTAEDEILRIGTAQPGFGFPSCHIGMPIGELKGTWVKHEDESPLLTKENERGWFVNIFAGLCLNYRNGRIYSVLVEYPERNSSYYANFSGTIEGGIDGSATIREIFETFGEPDRISRGLRYDSEIEETSLSYFDMGVVFTFHNRKLGIVAIVRKNSIPILPSMGEDTGDVSALRALAREVVRETETAELND